jgi:hypothetical protein
MFVGVNLMIVESELDDCWSELDDCWSVGVN